MDSEVNITFARDSQPDAELRNFWPPEDGFVWSSGRWAEVLFAFPSSEASGDACEIVLDLDVFKSPPDLDGQNVLFYLNGLRLGSRLVNKRSTVFLDCPLSLIKSIDNLLTFDTPDAAKPSSFSGNDHRILGIQLFSIQARKMTAA